MQTRFPGSFQSTLQSMCLAVADEDRATREKKCNICLIMQQLSQPYSTTMIFSVQVKKTIGDNSSMVLTDLRFMGCGWSNGWWSQDKPRIALRQICLHCKRKTNKNYRIQYDKFILHTFLKYYTIQLEAHSEERILPPRTAWSTRTYRAQ